MRRLALAILLVGAVAQAGDYRAAQFAELSDRHVSRRGELALQLPGVNWVHGESDHFIYHFEPGFLGPQFAVAAELFYRLAKQDLGITEDSFERKARIYVFLNEQTWTGFVGAARLDRWTGSLQAGNELFVCSRANQKLDLSPALPHEITHLVVRRFVGDLPLWLEEGVAQFAGRRARAHYVRTRMNAQMRMPLGMVPRDEFIRLRELTGAVDYPADADRVKTFYLESELLVRFLRFQPGGAEAFLKFLRLQSQGRQFASALDQVYGRQFRDMDALERVFAAEIAREAGD
jgi:hypothetical protein